MKSIELISLILYVSKTLADEKIFLPNTDFKNNLNWDRGALPDKTDGIVFGGIYDFPVEIPSSKIEACELILPEKGLIVLPKNGSIAIGVNGESKCQNKDIFIPKERLYWNDPKNWYSKNVNLATPDLEKIPCRCDTVRFPPGATLSLYITDPMIKEIYINDKKLSQMSLVSMMTSETSSIIFKRDPNAQSWKLQSTLPVIVIAPNSRCEDDTGSICQYEIQAFADEENACYKANQECIEPNCLDPIQPYGSCCPLCGSQLLFKYEPNFHLNKFKVKLENFIKKSGIKKAIDSHVSKTYYNFIQIILVEHGEYEGYTESLAMFLTREILQDSAIGLKAVNEFTSGDPYDPERHSGSLGILAWTCVSSLSISLAIYIYYYKSGRFLGRPLVASSFVFKRFDNVSKNENENEEEPNEKEIAIYEIKPKPAPSKSFANPMFCIEPLLGNDTYMTSSLNMSGMTAPSDIIIKSETNETTVQTFQELKEKYEEDME